MFAIFRTFIYLSLIVGLLLVFGPGRIGSWSGLLRPETIGPMQVVGLLVAIAGAGLALWCVVLFAFLGKGTPLPFDPPRRLIVRGPYRQVRNPMAVGVGIVLVGSALIYESWSLLFYAAIFYLVIHLFVVLYEEPTLRQTFGGEYEDYCSRVGRWLPRWIRDLPAGQRRNR